MSLVSNVGSLLFNTRRASDSEMSMMNATNRMMNRTMLASANPSFGMANIKMLHEQEKDDMAKLQTCKLMRRISQAMAESAEKKIKAENLDYYV